MSKQLDRLTGQLYNLPAIVGRLGLSIAEAQRELDASYLHALHQLMALVNDTVGQHDSSDEKVAAVRSLLESLAPSRYQFTETTLEFSADLAEHLSVGAEVGASVGVPAVTVNASLSVGFARDYSAAARVKTVLHAYQNAELAKNLLSRAKELDQSKLDLPKRTGVDKEIWDSTRAIYESISAQTAKPTTHSDSNDDG